MQEATPGSVGFADQQQIDSGGDGLVRARRRTREGPSVGSGEPRRRRLLLHLGAFAWCLLVAVYATWPLAARAGTHVAGNLGDPLEVAWQFAWGAHAVVHQPLHLFDANMFHPERLTLAYSENQLGVSLPVAPVFWLTGNALLTLNTELLLVLAAAGFGVYLLTYEVTASRGAALVAGTAYTAMPFRVSAAGLGHAHILALHAAPLVLLVLLRLRRDRSWRLVAALAALVALAWWSSLTGAFLTMVAMATWAVWETVRLRRDAWPLLWRAGVGTAIGLVASLPVLWPYVEVRRLHPGYGHADQEVIALSATAGSYLSPPPGGPVMAGPYRELSERFRSPTAAGEKELFPGFFVLGACAASLLAAGMTALRRRHAPSVRISGDGMAGLFGAATVAAVVLSFGPRYGARPDGLPMPFAAVNALVPGTLMRVPAWFAALALLMMAVGAGIGLARLRPGPRRLVVAGSLVFLALEFMPVHVRMLEAPPRTAAHEAVAGRPGAVLGLPTLEWDAEGTLITPSLWRESQHMYLSTAHFRPMTNGWAAYHPPGAFTLARAVADIPSPGAFAALRGRDVRTVIVQTDLTAGTRWAGVEDRLARWPGVRLVARSRGVAVFDVARAAG
jgi:hypothetical protein